MRERARATALTLAHTCPPARLLPTTKARALRRAAPGAAHASCGVAMQTCLA